MTSGSEGASAATSLAFCSICSFTFWIVDDDKTGSVFSVVGVVFADDLFFPDLG